MDRYLSTLKKLYQVNISKKDQHYDLEAMHKLDALLGYPSRSFHSVHLAGTNGKGTVGHKIFHALKTSSQSVGIFSSPHIATFRERMVVDGQMIPERCVVEGLERIWDLAKKNNIALRFFEVVTLLAFLHFQEKNVDIAIVETGLGGRLDATNIIRPLLSIITSIGLDHCEILGDTLEEIAREKAGIIKQNCPVILGPGIPVVVEKIAEEKKAPVVVVPLSSSDPNRINTDIARTAIKVLHDQMGYQINSCYDFSSLPLFRQDVRFICGEQYVFDVAHNPMGFQALKQFLGNSEAAWLLSFSKEKQIAACLQEIQEKGRVSVPVAFLGETHPRLAESSELIKEAKILGIDASGFSNSRQAIQWLHQKKQKKGPIVVAGSFFMMGDVMKALEQKMDSDPVELNEL